MKVADCADPDRGPIFADYLALAEMAHELGVSERTLTRWHNLRWGRRGP